ncbi:hypothetical protein BDN72DRAFT_965505 [Pluteus cervinus]|uniref:Uncharacterized protein n=1 Tax=Pluteus cervinus TaxID=181527 RepID=A0ACD3A522_9AGAR|nr:hypothetical protein BDN72DRAFT_965505 [Pluteus cervinus]
MKLFTSFVATLTTTLLLLTTAHGAVLGRQSSDNRDGEDCDTRACLLADG